MWRRYPPRPCPVSGQWPLGLFWSPKPVFPHSCLVAESIWCPLLPVLHLESHLARRVGGSPPNSNILSNPVVRPAGLLEPQGPGGGPCTSNVASGHPVSLLGQWSKPLFQHGPLVRIPVRFQLWATVSSVTHFPSRLTLTCPLASTGFASPQPLRLRVEAPQLTEGSPPLPGATFTLLRPVIGSTSCTGHPVPSSNGTQSVEYTHCPEGQSPCIAWVA